jgi:hypothetical protein
MNEVMLELISSIERLGTIGLVIGIIIAVLVVIGAVYGFIKQFLDMSDIRSYITKQEEYEKVLSTSKNKEEQTVITKKDELNEELEDMKERYSKRSNIYFGFGLILLVLFIAGVGVYSARSYKLDQLNEKLSAIEINNIEDHGIIAEGELKASIENKKVQLNMIVRVTNISGEKLLHAQIVDNVSGVKINIGELEANKEVTYEILQNVNENTKLDLEVVDCEFAY